MLTRQNAEEIHRYPALADDPAPSRFIHAARDNDFKVTVTSEVTVTLKSLCQSNRVEESAVQPALEVSLQQEDADAIGRPFMRTIGSVGLQVHAVKDDRGGRFCNPVPVLPPFANELTLIDDTVREAGAEERQHGVAIFRADGVAHSRPADALHPVDSVQPLDDLHAAAFGPP